MSKAFTALFGSACLLGVIINFPKILEIAKSTDGGYSAWTEWSVCTRTCEGGRRGKYPKLSSLLAHLYMQQVFILRVGLELPKPVVNSGCVVAWWQQHPFLFIITCR